MPDFIGFWFLPGARNLPDMSGKKDCVPLVPGSFSFFQTSVLILVRDSPELLNQIIGTCCGCGRGIP